MSSNAPSSAAGAASIPFPMLVLAAIVVGAGIYYVAQWDDTAGWLLAGLILLGIAFAYPTFPGEISKIFGATSGTPTSPNAAQNGAVVTSNSAAADSTGV